MPTFIMLVRLTHQGACSVRDSPPRVKAAREMLRSMGGELKAFYATMGSIDGVVIAEAPDQKTMAKFAYAVLSAGAVSTETLIAFSEEEHREMLGSLDQPKGK